MSATSSFIRFRTRLLLLVLLMVVPAFGLVLLGNLEQRRIEKAGVREFGEGEVDFATRTRVIEMFHCKDEVGIPKATPHAKDNASTGLRLRVDSESSGLICAVRCVAGNLKIARSRALC
jgi:hypothetical protein